MRMTGTPCTVAAPRTGVKRRPTRRAVPQPWRATLAQSLTINQLRVFRSANTAHLGCGVSQERRLRVGPSEKYAARCGSMWDERRMRTACFARAPQRCTSRLSKFFLLTFQEVTLLSKTRNRLHILDGFHLTMKLTGLEQYGKGLVPCEAALGEEIREKIARLKWSLWHGQVDKALGKIDDLASAIAPFSETYARFTHLVKALSAWRKRVRQQYPFLFIKRRPKGHLNRAGHLTSCACAIASGPWDRGAPSLDISCTPCLSADRTCSIWFSPLPLSPHCRLVQPGYMESLAE